MPSLLSQKLLCFDVYGTLIDWETGIYQAATPLLSQLTPTPTRESFLRTYTAHETAQQAQTPGLRYSDLLALVYTQLATQYGLPAPAPAAAEAFGASIGTWSAFPDSGAALRKLKETYKLVVLSNVDGRSFDVSLKHLGWEGVFDLVLTAELVGGYKPALGGFEYMLREVQERFGVAREEVMVTAQSLFHDHVPAKRLGLKSVWIDRAGAVMGLGVEDKVYEWSFRTLGEMAEEVEREKGVRDETAVLS